MAERVRVWEITSKEGNRLLRIVRRSTGSVVTWWRAQMVLLSAQGMLMGPTPCIRATAVAVRRSSPWPSAVDAQPGDPEVVVCVDEFGPFNLQPHPGHHYTRDRRLGKSSTGQTLPDAVLVSRSRQVGARVVLAGRAPDVP